MMAGTGCSLPRTDLQGYMKHDGTQLLNNSHTLKWIPKNVYNITNIQDNFSLRIGLDQIYKNAKNQICEL